VNKGFETMHDVTLKTAARLADTPVIYVAPDSSP